MADPKGSWKVLNPGYPDGRVEHTCKPMPFDAAGWRASTGVDVGVGAVVQCERCGQLWRLSGSEEAGWVWVPLGPVPGVGVPGVQVDPSVQSVQSSGPRLLRGDGS